jgi:hypothetical protein
MFHKSPAIPMISGILAYALLAAGCDRMLPTEFRKKTGSPVSGLDSRACGLMTADTADAVRLDAAVLPRPAIEAWRDADDAFIRANLDTVQAETALLIRNPQMEDTVFAFLPLPEGPPAETVFYLSWGLSPQSIDATVDFAVFEADGGLVLPVSGAMKPELVAACTQSVETGGQPTAVPKIRGRFAYAFKPAQARLLIRFILSKPQAVGSLQLAVLHGNGSDL